MVSVDTSVGFQPDQGAMYLVPYHTYTESFKPGYHPKWLGLVLFYLKCEIIGAVALRCDYLVNIPFLNISFCLD